MCARLEAEQKEGDIAMRLRVALLTLSQASSVLSFVQHPGPQVFGSSSSSCSASSTGSTRKRSNAVVSMVASIPTSTTVSTTQGIDGAGRVQGGTETAASVGTGAPEAAELEQKPAGGLRTVEMYDTTLRDGTQMEGISASVNDKLKIALQLYNFGRLARLGLARIGFGLGCFRLGWLIVVLQYHGSCSKLIS